MSLEMNLSNMCRTCLSENRSMKSVFSFEQVMEQKIMLCDMLMSCTSVLILHGDGLPETICLNCSQQVNTAYLFKKLCERSDAVLRDYTVVTNVQEHQNNVFTIQVENGKFNSSLGLNNENNYKELNVENCEAAVDESRTVNQDYSDDDDNETSDKCNYSLDSPPENKEYKVFTCEQCGKEFNGKKLLARHMSVHRNNVSQTKIHKNNSGIVRKRNQSRTCDICNKTFRFHSNLERHKLTHTGEKPYLCNVCGKGFAQMAYLKIHSFIHTGEKPYKCQMCERSFTAPGTLMTHIRTHTGERPHICKICGKTFPQSGYLSAHIRTHTGEKPIECKVCNQRFNQSGRLIIHMRIHSGEKPYQCTMCEKSFAVKGTLKKHIRTHTGERPYKCKVCGQAFAQSGTLTTHTKVHLPKVDNEKLVPWT